MKLYRIKLTAFFSMFLLFQNIRMAASDLTCTVTHCVPVWGQSGTLHFEIDTAYKKGPFFVRLDGPGGLLDTMANFDRLSHTFTGLQPGQYCLSVRCCTTCEARVCLDINSFEQLGVDDVSVLWAKEKTPPETDSTAILLACTELEQEEGIVCGAVFSLYAPTDLPVDQLQSMIKKALACMREIQQTGYSEFQDNGNDTWIPDPFKVLWRFEEDGRIRWVYSD